MRKTRSSQVSTSVNSCHELSKTPIFPVSIAKIIKVYLKWVVTEILIVPRQGSYKKEYIRRNKNKADSIKTGCIVIAHLLP